MNAPDDTTTDGAPEITTDAPPESPAAAVQAKAAEVLRDMEAEPVRRGPGRPRGSKTRNRNRAGRGASARVEAAPEPPAPPAELSEAEMQGLAFALQLAWGLAGARLRRRPLTDSESLQLAQAAHPVLAKYGFGTLDKYAPEITLGMTLLGLWQATELPPEPPAKPPGEAVEQAA